MTRLRDDFPDDVEFLRQLNRYGSRQGVSLLEEGGEATKNLAEGASMFPQGQKIAADFFDAKISMAPDRLNKVVSRAVSPQVNFFDAVDDIYRTGQAKAAPLYQKAFQANKQVESPLINRVLETPAGKKAPTRPSSSVLCVAIKFQSPPSCLSSVIDTFAAGLPRVVFKI